MDSLSHVEGSLITVLQEYFSLRLEVCEVHKSSSTIFWGKVGGGSMCKGRAVRFLSVHRGEAERSFESRLLLFNGSFVLCAPYRRRLLKKTFSPCLHDHRRHTPVRSRNGCRHVTCKLAMQGP